jgi:hypothetical protein
MSTEKIIQIGMKWREESEGYTVTGWGIVSKGWEIVSQDEDGKFNCKLLWNDATMGVGDYVKKMTESEISKLMRR